MSVMKFLLNLFTISTLLGFSSSQDIPSITPDSSSKVEGDFLNITCTLSSGSGAALGIVINDVVSVSNTRLVDGSTAVFLLGPLTSADDGSTFVCRDVITTLQSMPYILRVTHTPIITVDGSSSVTVVLSTSPLQDITFNYSIATYPSVNQSDIELLQDGTKVPGEKFRFTLTSVTVLQVGCDDSGDYTLMIANEAGLQSSVSFNITVSRAFLLFTGSTILTLSSEIQADVGLISRINGCPDNGTVICRLGDITLTSETFDVGDRTAIVWRRNSFTAGSLSGSAEVICELQRSGQPVVSQSFTLTYGSISCTESPLCLGLVLGIIFPAVVLLIVGIIVAVIVVMKHKNTSK